MNKLLFLLMGMLVLGLVGAQEIEYKKINRNEDLKFTCSINGAIPSSSATLNLTITTQNGTNLVNNQRATALGNGAFNYSYTFQEKGEYLVQAFCYDGTDSISAEGLYIVNPLGEELTIARATMYILAFFISLFIVIGLIAYSSSIQVPDGKDKMTGYILYVSNLKYLKMFLLALSYVFIIFISYFAWMIVYAFLNMDFVATVLQFVFYFLAIASLPLFILYVYLNISNLVRDSKVKEALSRGLRIRE